MLQENKLTGPIPESLGACRALEVLGLHSNMLSGKVPSDALMKCPKLRYFELGTISPDSESAKSYSDWMKQNKEQMGSPAFGEGNKDLTITAMGKALLLQKVEPLLKQHFSYYAAQVASADPHRLGVMFPAVVG